MFIKNKICIFIFLSCFSGVLSARGGEAFAGSMFGSMTGTMLGSAMTQKSSSSDEGLRDRIRDLHEALKTFDRNVTKRFEILEEKIKELEKEIKTLKNKK
ncbi:hypothetical protein K9L05_03465 [Candidatus Babeliales bacterium]|nr:hypothetical protein [Candidatus Babeliales bacterium]MCF7899679.1 hypothetical protein [Candidatus Babeliales bacterium]